MVEPQSFLGGKVVLHAGDCNETMAALEAGSFDAAVTDAPYHLASIVKRFGAGNAAPAKDRDGLYARSSRGFMGKQWDGGDVAFRVETWAAVLRLLKPGAHLVAFAAPRNYHRMACAIEDAGFEIRDMISWLYGSGFPKSHNQGDGLGTALKPAYEPIVLARKPLIGTVAANLAEHGTGALNIDGCRVETADAWNPSTRGPSDSIGTFKTGTRTTEQHANGRWPANVVHDGSDEVVSAFPETTSGTFAASHADRGKAAEILGAMSGRERNHDFIGSSGSASRFFYSAKADADDRIGSKHPTVKPVDLMQWLCRLVCPKGGLILDPFAGTGTTGEAAWREGIRAVLIEREDEYRADIARRMDLATAGPDGRRHGIAKVKAAVGDPLPLFSGDIA